MLKIMEKGPDRFFKDIKTDADIVKKIDSLFPGSDLFDASAADIAGAKILGYALGGYLWHYCIESCWEVTDIIRLISMSNNAAEDKMSALDYLFEAEAKKFGDNETTFIYYTLWKNGGYKIMQASRVILAHVCIEYLAHTQTKTPMIERIRERVRNAALTEDEIAVLSRTEKEIAKMQENKGIPASEIDLDDTLEETTEESKKREKEFRETLEADMAEEPDNLFDIPEPDEEWHADKMVFSDAPGDEKTAKRKKRNRRNDAELDIS